MAYVPNSGSVVAFQSQPSSLLVGASIIGLTPVNVTNMPSPSVIAYQAAGSVLAVSGTVTVGNTSVTAFQGGAWTVSVVGNMNSSVTAYQGGAWSTSMVGVASVTQAGSWNVGLLGSVIAVQAGGFAITSVMNTVPSSMLVGASIIGLTPVNVTNMTSVAAMQGTTPWVVQSILGTFAEDSSHVSGDAGLFTLGVRNDTMSSVQSADGDYSYHAVGPVGETLVANSPLTKWIMGQTSVMYGTSVQAIAPQGASIFTYVTGVQLVNSSPNNVYVTFTGGLGGVSSILGFSAAPANGGSNIYYQNGIKTGQNSGFSASISGVGSVFLSVQGFISKT